MRSLRPPRSGDLQQITLEIGRLVEVRDFHPGVEALGVLRRPSLELEFGRGGQEELDLSRYIRVLVSQREYDDALRFLDLRDLGIADQIDIALQQEPERGLIQRDPILVIQVKILDREIASIRNDNLPGRQRIVEAEPARALHIKLAPHALIVGAGLDELAMKCAEVSEVVAYLFDKRDLTSGEVRSARRSFRGYLCTPA